MSSVKKKSNSVLPNIEDVRKMTTNSKSDFQQKIDTGVSKAFEKITKDSDKKMREAAAEGRSSARLFNWKYCEDPNDNTYKDELIIIDSDDSDNDNNNSNSNSKCLILLDEDENENENTKSKSKSKSNCLINLDWN